MDELRALIANIWGYRQLRPLQPEAMQAVLDGRDSLVVLPTGSGKSLCYQAPAVYLDGITVVISPLIALMKDQVDSLREYGITALTYHSHMTESGVASGPRVDSVGPGSADLRLAGADDQ
jgi:ATP-dependent DNA helicase RecQ